MVAVDVPLLLAGLAATDPAVLLGSSLGLWIGLGGSCVVAVRRQGHGIAARPRPDATAVGRPRARRRASAVAALIGVCDHRRARSRDRPEPAAGRPHRPHRADRPRRRCSTSSSSTSSRSSAPRSSRSCSSAASCRARSPPAAVPRIGDRGPGDRVRARAPEPRRTAAATSATFLLIRPSASALGVHPPVLGPPRPGHVHPRHVQRDHRDDRVCSRR